MMRARAMHMAAATGSRRRRAAAAGRARWSPAAMRWKRLARVAPLARRPAAAAAFALSLAHSLHLHFHARFAWGRIGAAARERAARDAGVSLAQPRNIVATAPRASSPASPLLPRGLPMIALRDPVARLAAGRAPRMRAVQPQARTWHEPAAHAFAAPSRSAPMARAALAPSRPAPRAPEERAFARRATLSGAFAAPTAGRGAGVAPASAAPSASGRKGTPLARPAELYWPRLDPSHVDAFVASPGRARAASAPARAEFDAAGRSTGAAVPAAAAAAARAPAALLLDRAAVDRLAEDVIRRVERHVRIERERRGL